MIFLNIFIRQHLPPLFDFVVSRTLGLPLAETAEALLVSRCLFLKLRQLPLTPLINSNKELDSSNEVVFRISNPSPLFLILSTLKMILSFFSCSQSPLPFPVTQSSLSLYHSYTFRIFSLHIAPLQPCQAKSQHFFLRPFFFVSPLHFAIFDFAICLIVFLAASYHFSLYIDICLSSQSRVDFRTTD